MRNILGDVLRWIKGDKGTNKGKTSRRDKRGLEGHSVSLEHQVNFYYPSASLDESRKRDKSKPLVYNHTVWTKPVHDETKETKSVKPATFRQKWTEWVDNARQVDKYYKMSRQTRMV